MTLTEGCVKYPPIGLYIVTSPATPPNEQKGGESEYTCLGYANVDS